MMLSIFSCACWLFVCLLGRNICSSSWLIFTIRLLNCAHSLHVLDTSLSSHILFENIFSHSVGYLFSLENDLWCIKLKFWWSPVYLSFLVNSGSWWWTGRPGVLRFMGSQRVGHDWATDLIWSCVTCAFGIIFKNSLPNLRSCRFAPMFSSKNFIVLALQLRSLIYFWINFHLWCEGSNFILLDVDILLSQSHFLETVFFPSQWSWHFCWTSIDYRYMSAFLDS